MRDLNAAIEDAVSISVYLKRHEDFVAMNDVYRRFWPVDAPTRTTIMAGLRHPDALIEITALVVPRGVQRDVIQSARVEAVTQSVQLRHSQRAYVVHVGAGAAQPARRHVDSW